MGWKRLKENKVPRWVKGERKPYLKGRTFLYKRVKGLWYRKFRNEWIHPIPWWQYFLIALISSILGAVVATIIIRG